MDALLQRIAHHEGLRLEAYRDTVGVWTIAFGHTRDVKEGDTCTIEQAQTWLKEDVDEAKAVAMQTPEWPFLDTDGRRGVWIEMVFNLGWGKLSKFNGTRRAIRAQSWAEVATHMLDSLWARQVKGRAKTLASIMERGW